METRTLLTVIALLLAGIVTIMLAREGADSGNYGIFTNNMRDATWESAPPLERAPGSEPESVGQLSHLELQLQL